MTASHQGACFCGTVQVEVSGDPDTMAYCHCASCRSWSGSPVHVHYSESVLPIDDGLPKYRDFPTEFGGSGELVPP